MSNDQPANENAKPVPKSWLKSVVIVIALVGAFAVVTPMLFGGLSTTEQKSVLTHRIARGDLKVTVTENGMLESSNNKEIKCLVKGGSTVLWVIETGTLVQPGDELVRLDTSRIEDNITTQEIAYETALANKIITESDVAVAEKSITEYLEGTFIEERSLLEKEIFDAEQAVKAAELDLKSTTRLASKGLIKSLQIDGDRFALDSARKQLELKKTQLQTLELYKRDKETQQLTSTLQAAKARLASDVARLKLEKTRLEREREQLENCVIKAATAGMVIFPSAAEWKETPDIEEGATVREQQTLLMIPDLEQMQVKVGIHESKVGRLNTGMAAQIALQDLALEGAVDTIASITKPAGWWTGNMVKYDTIIKLDPQPGLKPGMSAVVDIVLANYEDVLTIPVAAIVESNEGFLCWVQSEFGVKKRVIQLGDSNDEFTIVTAGLTEGEKVVLNPLAFVDEAQNAALQPKQSSDPVDKNTSDKNTLDKKSLDLKKPDKKKSGKKSLGKKPLGKDSDRHDVYDNQSGEGATSTKAADTIDAAQLIAMGDKNGDGVMTKDEFPAKDRDQFDRVDTDGDGKVTTSEMEAIADALSGK
ncbi:MAG: efflux RND transporter periplasmic adaptor subunit [Pirellulaceae bacterium]|nr:efflux RND transporter periplasmic adaptor subunit [Pirellulaceae bacterium]